MWALAEAGHTSPALFDVIAELMNVNWKDRNSEGLANTGWAVASVGHASQGALGASAESQE
eukprot:7946849-Karenia_brevis.AAC.1